VVICMRVSAGWLGQCMVSNRYNAFVHRLHIWYTDAKQVARPQHCSKKSHPAKTSSKVSHLAAFSVHCVWSHCPSVSFIYCKMMLIPQANKLSSPWCMVRFEEGRWTSLSAADGEDVQWALDKGWEIKDWVGQNPLETKHHLMKENEWQDWHQRRLNKLHQVRFTFV
jgi:hypothetical protein